MTECIELPCPEDYPVLADYMKAVKPDRAAWDFLHRDGIRSPAEYWRQCMDNE